MAETASLSPVHESLFGSMESLVVRTISDAARTCLRDRLSQLKQQLKDREEAELERIQKEQERVDFDIARLDEMKGKIEKIASSAADEIVHLNVGGKIFSAGKQTFLSAPDSFFANLLNNDVFEKSEDGSYFIDRDPHMFPHIMSFLRTGQWYTNCLAPDDLDRLETELDFYALSLPRDWGTFDSFKSYSGITLENEGHTCTGSGTTLGKDPLPSHAVWDVTIDAKTGNAWTGIGIATALTDTASLCTDTPYGCGLYIDQNNVHFRQKGNNIGDNLNNIIGPATPGKVIRITYNRTETSSTIKFQVEDRSTEAYSVMLPDRRVYVAMSPTSDCVMSLIVISEDEELAGEGEEAQ